MTRIFYFAYDHQRPTGGQKSVYRHVDILRNHGADAYILHLAPGFRLQWFANETPVISGDEFSRMFDARQDIVVLPEDLGENILQFPGRKVIINQSVHYGFNAFPRKRSIKDPYLDPSVIGVMVKSEHSRDYLLFAYPRQKVIRIFNGIDPSKYSFCDLARKQRVIACSGVKNQMELKQIFHMANARAAQGLNNLDRYRWAFIQDLSEARTAEVLSESLVFLFLSTMEGFGRMPIEAMMSGCMVCAFRIAPMTEYLSDDNALLAAPGDMTGMVRNLKQAVAWFEQEPEIVQKLACVARAAASRYSPALEEQSVVDAWQQLLEPKLC